MMGFDWLTFAFETINFLVLVWVLQRIVYRPLRDGIRARREAIEAKAEAATRRLADADDRAKELAAQAADIDQVRAKALRAATEEATEQRARILEQAREDALAERARSDKVLEVERAAARAWVREIAVERGTEVAAELLMRLAPKAVDESLFEALLGEVRQQHETLKKALGEDETAPVDVEVTSCRFLDEGRTHRLTSCIEDALGRRPRLVVRQDESLRAGLAVHIGYHVLDASVSGQLDALRASVRRSLETEDALA